MSSCPIAFRRTVLVLGAVLLITQVTGCGDTTHVHGTNARRPVVFAELEPNDSPAFPDFIGYLDETSYVVVQGHVEAFGFDIVDHIEFVASEPVELEFSLFALSPYGDADVTIYDPLSNQVLGVYANSGEFETGRIVVHEAGRPFQFVIEAFGVATEWDLEIVAYPYCGCSALSSGNTGEAALSAPAISDGAESGGETLPWIETDAREVEPDDTSA